MIAPQIGMISLNFLTSMTGKSRAILLPMMVVGMIAFLHAEDTGSDPAVLFNAGATAFQAGNFDDAAKNFEAVLSMGPTGEALETILFSLAGTYFNQKNFTKAEEYFNRVLKEFPQGKNKTKALVSLSQIQMQSGRKDEAEKSLKLAAEGGGDIADRAKMAVVSIMVDAKKYPEATEILRGMLKGGIKNDLTVQAAMQLAEIQAKQGKLDEALTLLDQLQENSNLIDNPLQLDMLSVRIGDGFLEQKERKKALKMYAIVRPKEVVMALQKSRIEALEKQIATNRLSLQTNPKGFLEVSSVNSMIQSNINDLKKVLNQFDKAPDTSGPVRVRQAKAYDELDQKWETILIWESLLEGGDLKMREDALFTIGSSFCSLGRPGDADVALDKYLAEFPHGKYASQAGYLKGAVALEANDYVKAETVFGSLLAKGDTSELAADMQFHLANTQFAQAADPLKKDKYKEAIGNYKKYLSKYPGGKWAVESTFRIPLSYFMLGDYANALEGFESFDKKYPTSDFSGDAGYRIALCYNAAEKYDEVLKRCTEWEKKHSGENMHAEVVALEGDAYSGKNMSHESAVAYRRSVEMGGSEELLKYSLFEANKQYQVNSGWDDIADMFSKFAARHPDHPAAVAAVYWVSKAKTKQGKNEEAKQYLAQTVLNTINERKKDAVEQLLSQLAQVCSKRPRAPLIVKDAPSAAPVDLNTNAPAADKTPAAPRPSATPLPPYDAEADFAKYLNEANIGNAPLAQARLRFAKAQLAGFTRKQDMQKELMASIYKDFSADQLSALLLAECGEIALDSGDTAKAGTFYTELMNAFPKSDLLEYAYYGMGEIALANNKPDEAIRWFDDAVDKAQAEVKLAQITFGKGQALLAQGKLDEAKKIFEQVAGTKEWRGEVTAQALVSLGDIENKRGNTAAATQYYQRVFVAYQRYPEVVVTAYLKAANAFIKLNKPEIAAAHLREMLSKPKLAQSPKADSARKLLEGLPAATTTPTQASSPTANQ